jgi:hypothetical protein
MFVDHRIPDGTGRVVTRGLREQNLAAELGLQFFNGERGSWIHGVDTG